MTPTIITLEACWLRRTTEVTIEIPSMAAINAAGAITKGISLVSQMSVCIFFFLVKDQCCAGNRINIVIQPDISTRQSKMARRTELETVDVIKSNVRIWFMVSSVLSIPGDLNSEQRIVGMMIRSDFSFAITRSSVRYWRSYTYYILYVKRIIPLYT